MSVSLLQVSEDLKKALEQIKILEERVAKLEKDQKPGHGSKD